VRRVTNPDFVRYRRELVEAKIAAFGALCFHLAEETPKPYAALMDAWRMEYPEHAQAIADRVLDAANGNFDSAALTNALVAAVEGPGVIPGLVEVVGGTGEWYVESRNIYQERGEPFTLDNLIPLCGYGLVRDPEHFFFDVRGTEMRLMFNCFHVTKEGAAFCAWLFPERVEALRKRG
jgi:hypothetical protein